MNAEERDREVRDRCAADDRMPASEVAADRLADISQEIEVLVNEAMGLIETHDPGGTWDDSNTGWRKQIMDALGAYGVQPGFTLAQTIEEVQDQ